MCIVIKCFFVFKRVIDFLWNFYLIVVLYVFVCWNIYLVKLYVFILNNGCLLINICKVFIIGKKLGYINI